MCVYGVYGYIFFLFFVFFFLCKADMEVVEWEKMRLKTGIKGCKARCNHQIYIREGMDGSIAFASFV